MQLMAEFRFVDAELCYGIDGHSMPNSHVLHLALCRMFQKELHNCIPNVAVWRMLRKRLHLKAYRLSTVQHLESFQTNGVIFQKIFLVSHRSTYQNAASLKMVKNISNVS
jgi:hypothetical protein